MVKENMSVISKTLDYSDIVLQPDDKKPGTIMSRDNVPVFIKFLGRTFKNPVLPANMAATISRELAGKLDPEYFYIHHRFEDYDNILKWIKEEQEYKRLISISVGVKNKDTDFLAKIADQKLRVDFITIDISHGYHLNVKSMAEYIREKFADKVKIIAGNVTSAKACKDYIKWGIDAAKVGIARGKACTTFNNTGVGSFMFSAVKECADTGLPIIADGGIREYKDIGIAMVAGANMVMIGSLFAACNDSPAEIYKPYPDLDIEYKIYYGSASSKNKGHSRYVEGLNRIELTPNKMNYLELHSKIEDALKSTMSFANVTDIKNLTRMKYLHK